jgi:hypothetical protein
MADIVEQRGGDQGGRDAVGFGERRALQRMIELTHSLEPVLALSLKNQSLEQKIGHVHRVLAALSQWTADIETPPPSCA